MKVNLFRQTKKTMMKSSKYLIVLVLALPVCFSGGCMEDTTQPEINFSLSNSARMLEFIEKNGDFANSASAPAQVSARELYAYRQNYKILDVRDKSEYDRGYIADAVNVKPEGLFDSVFIHSGAEPLRNIVLVCCNGQASAYYTSLLRSAGFRNIYFLKYGMASWNRDFAEEWLNALGSHQEITGFNDTVYVKDSLGRLPEFEFLNTQGTIEENCILRIKDILSKGFRENENFLGVLSELDHDKDYLICYGLFELYIPERYIPLSDFGHMAWTRWYDKLDFRSTVNLQTIPAGRQIIIYSVNGHSSACMTAFLTLLGYNVKTLLYGAHQLFYPRLLAQPSFSDELFTENEIMNYPYAQVSR